MDEIRNEVKNELMAQLEALSNARDGSNEAKNIAEIIEKLGGLHNGIVDEQEKIFDHDANRQKVYAEAEKLKVEKRKMENDLDKPEQPWFERISPDTLVSCGTIVVATGLVLIFDKANITPTRLFKFIPGVKLP